MASKAGSSDRRWHSVFAGVAWGLSTLAFVIAGVCLSVRDRCPGRSTDAHQHAEAAGSGERRDRPQREGSAGPAGVVPRVALHRRIPLADVVVRVAREPARGAVVHAGDEGGPRQGARDHRRRRQLRRDRARACHWRLGASAKKRGRGSAPSESPCGCGRRSPSRFPFAS